MNIFFDCEMTGLHQKTTLISIGMVAENGRTFYAENTDYDREQLTGWLEENVLKNMLTFEEGLLLNPHRAEYQDEIRGPNFELVGNLRHIQTAIHQWLAQFSGVRMWGDVLAYDWMLFCELFPVAGLEETAERLPRNIYYIPFDLATLMLSRGVDPDISRRDFALNKPDWEKKHNALYDALLVKGCYERLMEMPVNPRGFTFSTP